MITRDDALYCAEFHAGSESECSITVGPRGGVTTHIEIWRVSGMPKVWIRRPDVRVPVKHGMYQHSYVLWPSEADAWHTRENCPAIRQFQSQKESN